MVEREIEKFFIFFVFKKLIELPPPKCKTHGKNVKKFCKGLPAKVGQRRKSWFWEPPKCLFHHSENKPFKKNKYRKENTISQSLLLFRKIQTCWLTVIVGWSFHYLVLIKASSDVMKRFLALVKSKDSSRVSAFAQSQPDSPD